MDKDISRETKIISSQRIKEKTYWLEQLSGSPEKTGFPYDQRSPGTKEYIAETLEFSFSSNQAAALLKLCNNSDIRLFIILAAGLTLLLKKYTGSSDIILAAPIYKQQIKGDYINTILLLKNSVPPRITFKELLIHTARVIKEADENKNYPIEILMEQLNIPFYENECSLFDTALLLENIHDRQYLSPIKPAVIFSFARVGTDVGGIIAYNSRLYKQTTIENIAAHMKNLFQQFLNHPDITENDIDILSEVEKRQLLIVFNDTAAQYPDKGISDLFAGQVEKTPHYTALIYENASLTYRALDSRANLMAAYFKSKGITVDNIVALLLERSLEMITCILAILKSAGAYMPIDPEYPRERIDYMLKDSGTKLLVTVGNQEIEKLRRWEGEKNFEIVFLNSFFYSSLSTSDLPNFLTSHTFNLAYVIYTSGTTGKPKGSLITHKNVVRLLFNDRSRFDFNHRDIWAMFHSYCFDFSVWEMYGALFYGGKLVVVPRIVTRDPAQYLELLKNRGVTILNQTPTAFYNLIEEELKHLDHSLNLKYIIFGGEALNPFRLAKWHKKYPTTKLINMFGITETTVHVTYKEISDREIGLGVSNIGSPIPTLSTYIMDSYLSLMPIGAVGELCVAGDGIARGYLNRPEMTAEKFIENPYKSGEKMYRSGDLARLLNNGEMEYIGRLDQQIKIRGFRVELGEIQNRLLQHDSVKEAIVTIREDEDGEKSLYAYIVFHQPFEISKLRAFLAITLPDYMIPGYFIPLERIPLTANGKVDIKALPHAVVRGSVYLSPRNTIEETLAAIWVHELNLERVGIDENYFNIGGDSIKAIRLLNTVNQSFNTDLKIVDIFTHETIEKLAQRITREKPGQSTDSQSQEVKKEIEVLKTRAMEKLPLLLAEDIEDIYPMSDIEKGMIYYTLKDPGDGAYHDQIVYQVPYRDFNPLTFTRALQLMTEKHPILRTSFQMENYEEPLQLVHKSVCIDMEHQDISSMDPALQEDFLINYLIADRKKGFVVSEAPLWRIRTFQIDSKQICILLVTHHAILDGWSVAAFSTELNNIYRHLKNNPHLTLHKLHSTYKDFIIDQLVEMRTNRVQDYWKDQLDGYQRMDFIKKNRGDTFTSARMYSFEPEQGLAVKLENCAWQYGSTVKHLCLAAYIYMLNMFSYENDITAGIVVMGRPVCEDGDKILGCFLNTIPFRLKIPDHFTWADYIREVERKQTEQANYSRTSLFEISRIIGETPQSNNPIFDTIYNFIDFHIYESVEYDEKTDAGAVNRNRQRLSISGYVKTNTLLDFHVDFTLGRFVVTINYTNSTFTGDEIKTLAYYFEQVLKTIITRPIEVISKDEIISPGEREKLLYKFNQTEADYPNSTTLQELFHKQVERTPYRVSLLGGENNTRRKQQITYNVLNEISGRLAHVLRTKGVKEDRVVGIMVERSIEFITGVFGILKAGGAYLPMDPVHPAARNRYMLQDSRAELLLTTKKTAAKIAFDRQMIYIDDLNITPGFFPDPVESSATGAGSIAYIIYTSGSTGKPKGVLIEHKAIVNRLHWMQQRYPIDGGDTLLQKTPFTFDVSVWEIFWWSLVGGRLCMLVPGGEKDPGVIIEVVQKNRVTVIHFVPSMLAVLLDFLSESGDDYKLSCLKQVITSGEALTLAHVSHFNAVLGQRYNIKLANFYGPTEATVDVTFFDCPLGEAMDIVPIGKPIDNIFLYILDKHGQLQPPGASGELCITGTGLARGYINNPGLTNEKFKTVQQWNGLNKNFSGGPGGRFFKKAPLALYKTGDLARWLPDGNIEFLGRIDRQIKIRGNRIELGEIENRLLEYPQVKEAAVEANLCAYFVPQVGADISISQLREYLQQHLPGYMVPLHYVRLEAMPLTPSGKIDRKSLPAPEIITDQSYLAPQDEIEKKLTGIWAEVLNITKPISSIANFFESGGHSLNAVALISRIHKAFDVKITLESLFKNPTIQKIAAHLKAAQPDKFLVIPAVEKKEYYPLSSAQERLYFLQQMIGAETVYNIPLVMLLHGPIDRAALERAFNRLIQRHESFRTSFHVVSGEIVQKVHENVKFEIEILADKGQEVVNAFIRLFDLSKAPLLRVGLIKKTTEEYILALDMHHIIVDGVSFTVLVRDFMQLYEKKELPPIRVQYKDFVQWRRMDLQEEMIRRQETYWVKEFAGDIPVLSLPTDYLRPAVQNFEGSTLRFVIDAEITGLLEKYAQEQETTVYTVLLTLYYILLAKLASQEDIVVGIPVAGRNHTDLENIIGMFVNTLAIRNYPNGSKSIKRFLAEVKENLLAGLGNQDYPIEDLIEKVYTGRDTSRNPLFSTVFVMQNVDMANRPKVENPGLRISPYNYENKTAKFDLTLRIVETGKRIACEFEYCTRLFVQSTVKHFVDYFINAANALRQGIDISIADLDILPETEKQRLLYDFNDTAAEYPRDKTIHGLFTEQVEQTPDLIAVVGSTVETPLQITYRQLNEQSNRLAYVLQTKGIELDTIVGIMMERSIEMLGGMIGILKSGSAYLPIDPEYPGERIKYMLKDSGVKLLVMTNHKESEKIGQWEGEKNLEIVFFDSLSFSSSLLTSYLPNFPTSHSFNLAYVIYTSGTTGQPKGSLIEHRNVVRLLFNDKFQFNFTDYDVWTLFHSLCFDFSVWEMYGALLYGGKLVIVPKMVAMDTIGFLELLNREVVTVLNQTPSAFYNLINEALSPYREGKKLYIKYVIFGGEALNTLKLRDWLAKYPQTSLINMFGITETTVHVTYKELNQKDVELSISNVGKPIPTLKVYILDKYLKQVPVGGEGEIYVGGDGVARGYLNRPELTSNKFINIHHSRLYRTGDLARYLSNGDMEYLGRIDQQVKIRGFRIELGEIENRLTKIAGIKEAVVIDREDESGDKYLCAYIVSKKEVIATELREYLSGNLPGYMIPSYFLQIDKIPITANGKIDRKALPKPGLKLSDSYIAPQSALEKQLARLWADVLGIEDNIGSDDNFFELGGHSLRATVLIARMHKEFHVKVPLVEIFRIPRLKELAVYIKGKKKEIYNAIEPCEAKEYYALSPAQKRLYILQHLVPDNTGYNMPNVIPLAGYVEKEKLESVFKELIKRHESLRTCFIKVNEEPVQRINKEVEFSIACMKSQAPGRPDFVGTFDLSQAPLLRVKLLTVDATSQMLLIDMHHIITDGVSQGILEKEFMMLYAGETLPTLRLQYKDYSEWQNSRQQKLLIKEQETYWLELFAGDIPVLNLAIDYPRPIMQSFEGANVRFVLTANESRVLKEAAVQTGATLYMSILSVFTILLSRLSGQEDIIVGAAIAARRHADLEKIIGMFVNTLAMRNNPVGEKSYREFLLDLKEQTLKAYENQEYPFEELVDNITVSRDTGRNPVFDAMFNLLNIQDYNDRIINTGTEEYQSTHQEGNAKFDLTLIGVDLGERFLFDIEYCTRLFKPETIDRFISYFKKLLDSISQDIDKKLCALDIITEEERNRVLYEWNDTRVDYPKDKTIHQLFEEQVDVTPDHIAVIGSWEREKENSGVENLSVASLHITYLQLNEQSNRLAYGLQTKRVGPDTIVAIMAERSVEMIIEILGILKAGGAYLPIDPEYPQERIDYMLKDSGAKLMKRRHARACAEEFLASSLPRFLASASSNLAYIIYTSGSTGKPKGVMVEHHSVINLIQTRAYRFKTGTPGRLLLATSICFDASVEQIFAALFFGNVCVVAAKETLLGKELLNGFLKQHAVTYLTVVPSILALISEDNNTLKGITVGGEPCPVSLARQWSKRCIFYNEYGPTETTVTVLEKKIIADEENTWCLPLGKPIPNIRIFILDAALKIVPMMVNGELFIEGAGVTRGYLNNPELTRGSFTNTPRKCAEKTSIWDTVFREERPQGRAKELGAPPHFEKTPAGMDPVKRLFNYHSPLTARHSPFVTHQSPIYKTGDLARWLPDGNIEFLGRIDQQVKIRGFRIELGEIENCLAKIVGIKEAVVIDREDETGDKYLCAYIVFTKEYEITELHRYLAKELPAHMVPAYFVPVEKIPQTTNGKIDRKSLPEPKTMSLKENIAHTVPTTAVEKKLVKIWQRVLGRDNIGIDENFFMIGGDSIKSIQIISRMNSEGYRLEMKDIFQHPVISELAPLVKKLERVPDQNAITGTILLTPIQQVFFSKDYTVPHHFNQSVMFYSRERFDADALKEVFAKIQEHHDALRMTYRFDVDDVDKENKKIIQTNHSLDYPLCFDEYDLRNRPNSLEELNIKVNRIQAGIDLEKGPLMKLGLFHLDNGDRLLIVIHHLVIDGISWRILFQDIETLYNQYRQGKTFALPRKTDSFKLWSEKLYSYANGQPFLKEKDYWGQLEANIVPGIPKDFEEKENNAEDIRSLSFRLEEEETNLLLTRVNHAFGTEINDILLTALGLGMKKTFGQDKVLLALEGHGREEILAETGIDISRTVGWFTSIYPVSMDMSYSGDLGRQIKEIKEKLRRIPNKGVGYGILKYLTDEKNKKEIEFKLKPQISFNYLGQFDADVKQMSSFEMAKESPGNPISTKNKREYEFDINGMISYNRLVIGVSYNHTHFKAETMASLTGNLQSELRRIISYCSVQEKREFTPSDFTYKSLSIDYLNRLMQLYTDVEDIYPLTPMQEGMLFHALVDEKSHSYFEQMSYRLEGKLDIHLTEKSLNELFKRHEILRTAFIYEEVERPLQVVLSKRAIDFYYEDIRSIDDKKEKEFFIAEFKEKDKRRSFVLSKSALMRVSILQLADSEYEFIWSFHHILMDGWCIGILNSEFFEIYSSYLGNRPYRLPDLKPYRTYIQWLEKQNKEASLSYWENYLDSYEEQVSMPRTNIIKNEPGKLGEINRRVSFLLDRDKTVGLNKLAAVNNVTLNVVTQVLWGIILGKYNGKEDVVFGAVVSGRTSELDGIESMVGLFINTIPVRIQFNEHMKFNYLLQKIQQEALTGEPYHYNPLAEIQSISSLKQNLLDHIFIFENYPIAERIEGYGKEENKSGKSLSVRLLDVEIFEQTNYDFNVLLGGSDQLSIIFQYNANVYERSFVERIGQHFSLAVDQVIKNGGLEIKKLNLLTEEEKSLLLYRFNNTAVEYPKDKSIHLLFQEQAEQIPDSIALIGPLLSIEENGLTSLNTNAANMLIQQSYNELNKQSIRLAHMLQTKGVGPDTIVAIMMERSVEMIIGILGILAAGGAYLPIDPEYPQARIDYMLKDSGAKLMIGRGEERKSRRAERNFIYISFSSNHASSNLDSSLPRFHNSDSSNSAYVIYTSGSTGKPKGVMVGHRNIMNFNQGIISHIPFSPGKAILALTTISFDIFVLETFLPLLNGLKVVIANEEQQKDPSLLGETIVKHCLDMLQVTPSTLHMLISHNGELHCLQGLKELMVGGEAFPDHLFTRVKEAFKGNIYNMYGPTETTVWSALKNLTLEETVNIGTPIANTQIFIVDRCNRLLPIGASGELCIGGDGVARGYLNRPELTSEKFCRHLWVERPRRGLQHSKLYRTGDLARCLLDGNIQFLGRIDQQVKVRGFRIELGEIESRLLECEGIKEAVVVIKEGDGADKYICAYIVSHPGNVLSDMKLREELAAKLPYYMIPSYIIQLERIPLTPNGKIDRNALPAPAMGEGEAGTAPRNDIEKKLAGIWSEVLGMAKEKPGIDHNFFQIGGHSLKAVIMISRIHKVFNVIISLVDFFQRPTIRQLSEYIKKAESDRFFSIEPAEKKEYYPLSSSQKRLLFLQQLEEFNVAYNMTAVLEWHGVLNREGVESTFQRLIARHESFRTSFHTHNGQAVQQIHPQVKFEIEYNHEADIDTGTKNFIKPFDLGQAPLLKVRLSEISPGRHLLMVDMHHIISDGVSVQLAMRDFMRLYGGEDLPPLGFQYKDYSQWQNEPQQKEILKKQRGYWSEEFAGDVPVLSLPLDYPRPLLQSFDGETVHFELNTEETRGLRATAKKIHGTLYMVLLALYTVFLAKMTGQEDIVVGTPVAGRRHKDLEEIIGNFVNTLALRNRLEGGMTFKDLLDKVKVNLLQAFENQEHPYEDLIEEVGVKRDTSRNPLFDAALALHNVDMPGEISWASSGNIKIKPVSIPGKTSKFDLTLQVIEGQEKIDLEFEYCNKLFMPSTIRRFVEYFKGILKEVLPEPAIRLREISIISPQEKQQLLAAFNHTQSQYPEYQTIDRLFGEQAVRTPDAISVAYNDNTITYRELECRAGQVTDYLGNKCGLKAGELAAILANRSENTIIGMLGILKAGGAYLPIDPDYPQERIDYILQDSGAKLLIVANDQEGEKVKSWEGEKVLLEEISKLPKSSSCSRTILASDLLNPRNIAYIIYTSGSTGRPKGVMVEHRNVVRLFFHEGCFFEFTGRDIWTMFHSPCFDFSVWEMYGALLFGGKVIVVSKMMARQPARYLELLKSKGVTVLNQTPSAFYALEAMELQSSDKKLHLRYVIFGGEVLHPIKLEKWRERYPETRLINMFGITETTVHVTYRELSAGDIRQDVRHIGRPIPTLSTYVVDRYQQLMPVGIVGELCVGGGGVARGYLNRVELTAERFVENSFEPGGRLYRSGDLAKITDGSDMEYLGRSDQQVQVRGFRVELGEIENQLLRHPLVKEAYVMDREDSTGEIYLCAYIAVDKEKGLDTAELRQHLHSRLPEYMIPSFFVRLETLPVTANGKVDRRALPAPAPGESKKNFTAPRDEIEKKLAEIWATVLGLDKNTIGIDNDFFELGGHSLKAGILAALIHKEMDVKIPLPEIFINSHIRDMAEYTRMAAKEKYLSIEPAKKKDYYALSSAQRRLYIMQHVDPSITAYNITQMYVIKGRLHIEKLVAAFRQLIQRHESLRTSFMLFAGEPVQKIHENVEFEIKCHDDNTGGRTIMDNFIMPFDLHHAPLLRVGLIKVKEEEHILMIDMHHIITDGVSTNILVRDFAACYENNPLPGLKLQYKDFSEWQNSEFVKKDMARQKTYWVNRFSGTIPRLNLDTDYERSETKSFAGESIHFVIDKELCHQVITLTQETETSIFMFLLAVYNVLLYHYSKQEDILVGSPIIGRRHADLQHIVGMFVNMLVYRNYPAGHKTFRGFLEEVKQNALQAYENQDYQFEQLIVDLNLQGTVGRNPLFDVVFSMQRIDLDMEENVHMNKAHGDSKGISPLQITPYPFKRQTTPFELIMSAYETDDAIMMSLDYAARLFKHSTAEKIIRHFQEVINQVVANMDIELQNIRLSHQFKPLMDVNILEDQDDFGF